MFSGLETCEFEFLEAIPKELVGGRLFMFNGVLQFLREQDGRLNRPRMYCETLEIISVLSNTAL